jgi:hypothetical protein
MARINLSALVDWQNGQKVTAEKVKQDREVIVLAINDNYDRIADLTSATQVTVPKEASWEAAQGQFQFQLTGDTFPDIPFILEVSMEGFTLTEGEEFIKLNSTTIELSDQNGVGAGTRVYARWYEVRSLKLFTDDLSIYNIMGVF